ncbi:MAG: FtsX-like permease family protein [Bacteroidota bacterium]
MLFHIAYRNVLRNWKRSIIIILAIASGLWGGIVASGVFFAMTDESVKSAINSRLSHVQIHHPRFLESRGMHDAMSDPDLLLETVRANPHVRAATARVVLEGMASTAETAVGVNIFGIDPADESSVTSIAGLLTGGSYFDGGRSHRTVIGEELATKLGAGLRSKIVLGTQDGDGHIVAASVRVVGIFRTESTGFDETSVFILRQDLENLVGVSDLVHEVAIVLNDPAELDPAVASLQESFSGYAVESWKVLAPELGYMNDFIGLYLEIFLAIIIFAMLFGITNTMLMSVLDRIREFGILAAIGMKGGRVFLMIMLESMVLTLTGALLGIGSGAGTVGILGETGIDLALFAEGMRRYGYVEQFYPVMPFVFYQQIVLWVILAAVLASLYPAWKAIRLDPAQAVRTY